MRARAVQATQPHSTNPTRLPGSHAAPYRLLHRTLPYGPPQPSQRDKFARHGEALLLAARGPSPLERCLGVLRLALGLLADVLRQGGWVSPARALRGAGCHRVREIWRDHGLLRQKGWVRGEAGLDRRALRRLKTVSA